MRAQGGPYVAEHIARACAGTVLTGDCSSAFDAISTDSRDVRQGDLFIPLSGANYDGHDFILPALEAGARGSLITRDINRDLFKHLSDYVLIQVQDTCRALSDLASAHRKIYSIPLIAVTGSSGKTTVKEMIAAVLRRSRSLLVSQANYNNYIGLPMTVLNLGPQHSAAVVEAGINLMGEMDDLARAASPDVAVITSIGPVHLEGLGTIENVAREKFKLIRALPADGVAVVPGQDQHLEPLVHEWAGRAVRFGIENGDVTASNLTMGRETRFRLNSPWGKHYVRLTVPGIHNVSNALAAAAACLSVGATLMDVASALADFSPPSMRMETVPLKGNRTLLRDCYNANPQSMKAALAVLRRYHQSDGPEGQTGWNGMQYGEQDHATGAEQRSRPVLAVLGDMYELGPDAELYHQQIGAEAALLGIERVLFVGSFAPSYGKGYLAAGGHDDAMTLALDNDQAWEAVREELGRYGTILVKGSRMMKMETITQRIVEGH